MRSIFPFILGVASLATQSRAGPNTFDKRILPKPWDLIIAPYMWGVAITSYDQVKNVTFDWVQKSRPNTAANRSYVEAAQDFVNGEARGVFRPVTDRYRVDANGTAHVCFIQTVEGNDLPNREFDVVVAPNKTILSYQRRVNMQPYLAPLLPDEILDPLDALKIVVRTMGFPIKVDSDAKAVPQVPTKYTRIKDQQIADMYTITGTGSAEFDPVVKTIVVGQYSKGWHVETRFGPHWFETVVDAQINGEILGIVDRISS